MIKKTYNISGFDCANCAAKAESHLNKQSDIEYARLDFSANRLYISYKDKEYSIDKIAKVIAEVESDPLEISELNTGSRNGSTKIFTNKMKILLARIIIAILGTLVCMFALGQNNDSAPWIRFAIYCVLTIEIVYDVFFKVILHIKNKTNILDHNLLITICCLGALTLSLIGLVQGEEHHLLQINDNYAIALHDEAMEAVMVVTLFQIGRVIETIATNKSKAAVMSAMELRVDTASLILNGEVKKVKPDDLHINDLILVTSGELIPIDGVIVEGEAYIDTSSLTGEYIPVKANVDTNVSSGCMLKSGTITIKVTKLYKDSTVSKIFDLITAGGEKKSKADDFIAKFAKYYTPFVVLAAVLVILIGGLVTKDWEAYVNKGLEVLVTGCPCAIVISVPLAYFSAVGLASKNGIVIKGGSYLDKLNNLGKLITDKTGTLTHGSFAIQEVHPSNCKEEDLLNYLYAAECLSNHPIGKAICHGHNFKKLASEQKSFLEIPGLGVESTYKGERIIAGCEKIMDKYHIKYEQVQTGGTVVYCSVDGMYIGYIVLADEIKEDAQPMVDLLHSENVEIILLTGDHENNAKDICNHLGIDRWHSELLPHQKTEILEEEMREYKKSVAFIGDGLNDAPSIIRSDIGIAMGGIGSDMAVENADIVIMNDDPAKVYDSVKIAKMARFTSLFNIIFALTIKIAVMLFAIFQSVLGNTEMMMIAVFADTGLTVLLVLNSLLLLYRKVKRPL